MKYLIIQFQNFNTKIHYKRTTYQNRHIFQIGIDLDSQKWRNNEICKDEKMKSQYILLKKENRFSQYIIIINIWNYLKLLFWIQI